MENWDRWAVELGRIREVALTQSGVATDRDAVPAKGRARATLERAFGGKDRVKAAAFVHLIVRERVVAVMVLMRFRDRPFTAKETQFLRAIAPVLAVGDALQQHLDNAAGTGRRRVWCAVING